MKKKNEYRMEILNIEKVAFHPECSDDGRPVFLNV